MDANLFEAICQRIEVCTDSINKICQDLGSNRQSFHTYRNSSPETIDRYARAKQIQCEILAEEIIEIADTTELGEKTKSTAQGIEITTGDMTEHRKLRIDSRKWLLSKLVPKKYGDKLDVTTNGKDMKQSVVSVDESKISEEQLEKIFEVIQNARLS